MKRYKLKMHYSTVALLVFCLIFFGAYSSVPAEDQIMGGTRINLVQGAVKVYPQEGGDGMEATINYPLEPGDQVQSDADARAEIILFNGTILRIGELSSLLINDISSHDGSAAIRMILNEGKLYVRQSDEAYNSEVQVDMEKATLRAWGNVLFRVDAFSDGTVQVFVHSGEVQVQSDVGRTVVKRGELFNLAGGTQLEVTALPPQDDFDLWNGRRDGVVIQPQLAYKYVPTEIKYVYPDLDPYGKWIDVDDYGYCWAPSVSVSWRPFYHGRWIYRKSNYIWISYEPWGWAPYHYGRWAYRSAIGWFWVPPRRYRVYWNPGAVAWYHGPDYVYWIPLAPYETYYGRGYFGPFSVNIISVNIFKIHGHKGGHKNIHTRGAFVRASRERFYKGHYDPVPYDRSGFSNNASFYQTAVPHVDRKDRKAYYSEKYEIKGKEWVTPRNRSQPRTTRSRSDSLWSEKRAGSREPVIKNRVVSDRQAEDKKIYQDERSRVRAQTPTKDYRKSEPLLGSGRTESPSPRVTPRSQVLTGRRSYVPYGNNERRQEAETRKEAVPSSRISPKRKEYSTSRPAYKAVAPRRVNRTNPSITNDRKYVSPRIEEKRSFPRTDRTIGNRGFRSSTDAPVRSRGSTAYRNSSG